MTSARIIVGAAREALRALPEASVHCAVTSPPYWSLRDYGVEGQLGREDTPEAYVEHLVEILGEVRRILRPEGTLWLNLGDCYAAGGRGGGGAFSSERRSYAALKDARGWRSPPAGLKPKDLVGLAWMAAFALRSAGWWLRSDIIWAKPNAMPESVTDRPTVAHEHVFLLAKSEAYYYDADAIREPHLTESIARAGRGRSDRHKHVEGAPGQPPQTLLHRVQHACHPSGKNSRNVWSIPPAQFRGAHFAVMPDELARRCVLAGTAPAVCSSCRAPRLRKTETRQVMIREDVEKFAKSAGGGKKRHRRTFNGESTWAPPERRHLGWEASCACAAPDAPAVVLDPFCGAGTTGLVATKAGRAFVGVEINKAFAEIARERIGMFARLEEAA